MTRRRYICKTCDVKGVEPVEARVKVQVTDLFTGRTLTHRMCEECVLRVATVGSKDLDALMREA